MKDGFHLPSLVGWPRGDISIRVWNGYHCPRISHYIYPEELLTRGCPLVTLIGSFPFHLPYASSEGMNRSYMTGLEFELSFSGPPAPYRTVRSRELPLYL
jgi:hypothetical protein